MDAREVPAAGDAAAVGAAPPARAPRRDAADLIGGAALALFGAWFFQHAFRYGMGDLRRMGPGWFPAAVGAVTVALGAAVFLPALFRAGETPRPALRPFATICAGVAAFALLIQPFGLVPATFALVAVAALAEAGFRPLHTLALAAALAALAVLVFVRGLGMPLAVARWGA